MSEFFDLDDPVVRSIYRARTSLLYTQPMLAEVALGMDIVILADSSWCKTAATDGKKIYFNRGFVISLFFDASNERTKMNGLNRIVAIIAHEIWHLMFGHLIRRGNRDKRYWNMAIDYIVNATIKHDKTGLLPSSALLDPRFTRDHTAEEVYDYIFKNNFPIAESLDEHLEPAPEENDGDTEETSTASIAKAMGDEDNGGKISSTADDGMPEALTHEEAMRLADRTRMIAIRAMEENGAGTLPGGLQREISNLIDAKLNWKKIIASSLRSTQGLDYTYDQLSDMTWASWLYHRRRWYSGCGYQKVFCAVLPTQSEGEKVDATIAIDASASMTNEMIRDILSEVGGVLNGFAEATIRVLCFDAEVTNVQMFKERDTRALKEFKRKKVRGGGATDFMSVWRYLTKEKIVPDRLIICTDGLPSGSWGMPRYCQTIFLVHDAKRKIKAPFGRTVYIE